MELNCIKQKIGLLSYGNNLIDVYKSHYTQDYYIARDIKISNLIHKQYKNVCILGHFPLTLCLTFNCNVTILDNSKLLDIYKEEFKKFYNINIILKDPLFEDVQDDIKPFDLIIYYDSEYKVPLKLLNYKHLNKDVFIMNTYLFFTFKHNKNTAYSLEDLIDIYPMKEIYLQGRVNYVNNHYTYYVYGKVND